MDVRVTFNGFPSLVAETRREVAVAVRESAEAIVNTAKESLHGSRSGRTYRRRGRSHTASAPGEAPSTDTGRLEDSGSVAVSVDGMSATVSFDTPYADTLENSLNRPFLGPASEKEAQNFDDRISKAVAAAARKVGK